MTPRPIRRAAVVGVLVLVLAGCRPGTTPGTPESVFTHADGWAAIDQAFGRYGPAVLSCAHQIATRESGHWPYAHRPGSRYYGILQMHAGFQGSADRAAAELGGGHWATVYDPYVAALAATYAFDEAGGSFRANWPTTPAGCP